MIVKHLKDIVGTDDEVKSETWASRRFLVADDNMGFSFHDTVIYAGTETRIWYKNHLEAVYCVAGEGEIESLEDGKIYPITDGTMYALNEHDEHLLRATTEDLRLVCVFNPPLTGIEIHDDDGSYPLLEPAKVD